MCSIGSRRVCRGFQKHQLIGSFRKFQMQFICCANKYMKENGDREIVIEKLFRTALFPQMIGALECTLIRINSPGEDVEILSI